MLKRKIFIITLMFLMVSIVVSGASQYNGFTDIIAQMEDEGRRVLDGKMVNVLEDDAYRMITYIPTSVCDLNSSGATMDYSFSSGKMYSDYAFRPKRISGTSLGVMNIYIAGIGNTHAVNLKVINKFDNSVVLNETVTAIKNQNTKITLDELRYDKVYYIELSNPNSGSTIQGAILVN